MVAIGLIGCGPGAPPASRNGSAARLPAEQCEVIRLAEEFVRENGYTSDPATADRSRIEWELGDDVSHPERTLEIRHNTLKPHSYGLRAGVPGDPLAWSVVFEYSDELTELAASVDPSHREQPDGAVVRVKLGQDNPKAIKQHMPLLLSSVTRLPPPEQVAEMCAAVSQK
jgi:hypothetical protein